MSSDEESISDKGRILSDIEDEQNDIEVVDAPQGAGEDENTEEVQRDETEGNEDGNGAKQVVQPKRVIKNPQPKLNAETLKGPKGIATLPSYFERVNFKGKGHEEQDLHAIIKTYEYWCHRLFPKFPFEACVDKLEKLGSKKSVQTHIKRIRFDLLVEEQENPIIDSSDEEMNVDGFVPIQSDEIDKQNKQFELLQAAPSINQPPLQLTEEQQNRIRLNKERAEKLRLEKLRKIRAKAEENLQISSQVLPGPSSAADKLQTDESEPEFDLESNAKGKSLLKKKSMQKLIKGANKEKHHNEDNSVVSIDGSSESNSEEAARVLENHASESINLSLGMDEDTIRDVRSSTILSPKRRRKKNVIESDDSDQEGEHTKADFGKNGLAEKHSNYFNGSSRKFRSISANIIDSDQSDDDIEMELLASKNLSLGTQTKQSSPRTREPIENSDFFIKAVRSSEDPDKENSPLDNQL
ncbi:hypothetical protein HUJ04_004648 [Dendroctonus ponderosae]